MAKVAVLKTKPETVLADYSRLMDLAEYKKQIKANETILKLNLSWSLYYPACSTEPWQLEGVLRKLAEDRIRNIHVVENRTVVTDAMKGAKLNKWLPIIKNYNHKFVPLTEVEWVRIKPKTPMLALHRIFLGTHRVPKMFIGKNIIHLPTMKTHGHTSVTGAIKNSFGGLITKRRHHCHKLIHEVLVDLMSIQKEIHPGIFAVMDGTVAGDGPGPRTMIPRIKNTILASDDQVAIDALSARMMGFEPLKIPFLKMCHDLGLGNADVEQIEIVGEDEEKIKKTNFHFRTGKSPVVFWDQVFRKGSLSSIEPLLFHTGLFNLCIFASAFYHDSIWYNLVGKRRINSFMKTEWGRLFQKY
ncbi:DUF362 domain-containing protein [Candidatus Woesearchaeota archaeon]|nr:DUF362 domain-containing protein [Candidatus Woesearchaeota archaeon]